MSTGAKKIGRTEQKPFDPALPLTNKRHEDFVQALFAGSKHSDAYRSAGYKVSKPETAYVEAYRLSRHPHIAPRLAYLRSRSADESMLTRAWLIAETRATYERATACGHHSAALKALRMLGLERNTFIPKAEVGRPGDFSDMTDAELDAYIADVEARLRLSENGKAPPPRSNGTGGQLH
jgi:hypothetical protein